VLVRMRWHKFHVESRKTEEETYPKKPFPEADSDQEPKDKSAPSPPERSVNRAALSRLLEPACSSYLRTSATNESRRRIRCLMVWSICRSCEYLNRQFGIEGYLICIATNGARLCGWRMIHLRNDIRARMHAALLQVQLSLQRSQYFIVNLLLVS
jgi:hypothetical protein